MGRVPNEGMDGSRRRSWRVLCRTSAASWHGPDLSQCKTRKYSSESLTCTQHIALFDVQAKRDAIRSTETTRMASAVLTSDMGLREHRVRQCAFQRSREGPTRSSVEKTRRLARLACTGVARYRSTEDLHKQTKSNERHSLRNDDKMNSERTHTQTHEHNAPART